MGFEKTFTAYLSGNEGNDRSMGIHFEYKKLKSDLNSCKLCRRDEASVDSHGDENYEDDLNQTLHHQSCHRCDGMFSELTKQAAIMADDFSLRVNRLVHLHFTPGIQRFISCFFQCFKDDSEALVCEGCMLLQFVVMNAIALRKILKKYDKVHKSTSGMNFKSKLQAKHLDIMQSPWLIELIAFYINLSGSSQNMMSGEVFGPISFDLNVTDEDSVLTLVLIDSEKLEHSFTCPICLDIVFQPYALSCGHIFCKSCACLAAGALIIEGLISASSESKCPVCRESGVCAEAICMSELGLLLQKRCKEEFKERLAEERRKILKQTKEYWDLQTINMMGLL